MLAAEHLPFEWFEKANMLNGRIGRSKMRRDQAEEITWPTKPDVLIFEAKCV